MYSESHGEQYINVTSVIFGHLQSIFTFEVTATVNPATDFSFLRVAFSVPGSTIKYSSASRKISKGSWSLVQTKCSSWLGSNVLLT